MRVFTDAEIVFLTSERLLARIATVGSDGMPHVTPVGWGLGSDQSTIEIGGHDLTATKKFRDVERDGRAAVVIDDVLPPWQPRGVEVRGKAEAIRGERPVIRIYPERVVGWGLDEGGRNARDVG
jgi:pyridoxamine 5'-phosphate oxidase family protein